MMTFYVIAYKNVYLGHDDKRTKDKTICKWTKNKNDGIWFSDEENAKRFAKQYFKNFNKYTIKEVNAEKYL